MRFHVQLTDLSVDLTHLSIYLTTIMELPFYCDTHNYYFNGQAGAAIHKVNESYLIVLDNYMVAGLAGLILSFIAIATL